MKTIFRSVVPAIAMYCLGMAPHASAQEEPAEPTAPVQRPGQKYFYLLGGSFSPESNSQFGDENGKLALGFGFGSRHSRHVAWEIELPYYYHSVNAPPLSSGFLVSDGRADISTMGLAGNVKLIYPIGRFEPYIGGGIGLYFTEFYVSRSFLGFPASFEADDIDIGFQLLAGFDYVYGEKGNSVGIQYRKLNLDASFGSPIPGPVKVGGSALLLSFRWTF